MLPRHVEACIRFAIDSGWTPNDRENLWLAFYIENDVAQFQPVATNASFVLRDGQWYLPLEPGLEWRPGDVRPAPDAEPEDS